MPLLFFETPKIIENIFKGWSFWVHKRFNILFRYEYIVNRLITYQDFVPHRLFHFMALIGLYVCC